MINTDKTQPFFDALLQHDVKAFIEKAPFLKTLDENYELSKAERLAFAKISFLAGEENLKTELLATLPYLQKLHPHHQGFLANTLIFILETWNPVYKDYFLPLLPDRIMLDQLAFNLARLYARLEQKKLMLEAVRSARDLGIDAIEFSTETDFDSFQNDEDFIKEVDVFTSWEYEQPIYDLVQFNLDVRFYHQNMRQINIDSIGIDYLETRGIFPDSIRRMSKLTHLSIANYSAGLPLPKDILNTLNQLMSVSFQPLEWGTPFPEELLELNLKQLEIPEYVLTTVSNYKNLECIHLHCKDAIEAIKEVVSYFPKIKFLHLSAMEGYEIKIPKEVEYLQNLERLTLEGPINNISKAFAKLNNLKKLRIQTGGTFSFHKEITALEHLEELTIVGSHFVEIPNSFGQLKKLKKLSLAYSYNEYMLTESKSRGAIRVKPIPLPRCFGELESLEELDLSFCAIDDLQPLSKLRKLKKVKIVGTKIKNADIVELTANIQREL